MKRRHYAPRCARALAAPNKKGKKKKRRKCACLRGLQDGLRENARRTSSSYVLSVLATPALKCAGGKEIAQFEQLHWRAAYFSDVMGEG